MDTLVQPAWTQDEFFGWAEGQDSRFEFDGLRPIAMTGGNNNHSMIISNLHFAVRGRLRRHPCRILGPDAGLETVSGAVRYPDGLITCSAFNGVDRLIPGVIAVFEVVSPGGKSNRTDRILKVREYAAVPSIRNYVMLESTSAGLTVLERRDDSESWTASTLMAGDTLALPALDIAIPVAELYEGVEFTDTPQDGEGR